MLDRAEERAQDAKLREEGKEQRRAWQHLGTRQQLSTAIDLVDLIVHFIPIVSLGQRCVATQTR